MDARRHHTPDRDLRTLGNLDIRVGRILGAEHEAAASRVEPLERELGVDDGDDDVPGPGADRAVDQDLVTVVDPGPIIESPDTRTMNVLTGSLMRCSFRSTGPP